jgi:hypothetical protein
MRPGAVLGVLLGLLVLVAAQRLPAGTVLRVGELRIPLSPAPTAVPAPPDPSRPLRLVGLVARVEGSGARLTGGILNDGPPIAIATEMFSISSGDGVFVLDAAPPVTLSTGERLPLNLLLPALAPGAPLTVVLAVPGLPAIEQPITWIQ